VTAALSLLVGVLLGSGAADSAGIVWQAIALAVLVVWLLTPWRRDARYQCVAMLLAGLLWSTQHVSRWRERLPEAGGADTRSLVEGRLVSVPVRVGETLRFDLEDRARRWRLQWRDPHARPYVGERWRFVVRVSPLAETVNFDGRDTARLAFRDGVHAAGVVLPSRLNAPLELATSSIHTVRARVSTRIRDAVADPDAAALITALAVGLTGSMSADQWRVFNATGTTHLVAISGLHVTLFSWLTYRFARRAWRYLPLTRWLDREPFALVAGLAAAGGYSLLAGLSVPTQRTWIMLALYVLAKLACRCVGGGRLWSLAMVAVLLVDPAAPLAAGFWLSFAAVGALLLFAGVSPMESPALRWWPVIRAQGVVMLALAPLSFAVFGAWSLVGLVVNLIAIPVISFVFVPLVLAGTVACLFEPALGAALFRAVAALYDLVWPALSASADLVPAWRASPPAAWFVVALPALFVLLCSWPWRLRLTSLAALPLLLTTPDAPDFGRAEIHVLDAGRGVAILVRTRAHLLLFDTGDSWGTRGSRSRDFLRPALDGLGMRAHVLVLPSLDEDRARAAAELVLDERVDRVLVGGGWPGSVLPVERCREQRLSWDGVELQLLEERRSRVCLLRVSVGGVSVLLPGDLDAAGERRLLDRMGAAALASDATLVGRRVSASASSARWIESVSPGLVIATGGIVHAHSRAEVLARWGAKADRVIDTRRDGAAILVLSEQGMELRATAREARFPFAWRRLE
jgi:competence protein ComEC